MDLPPALDFIPVPMQRARADGWTPDHQRRFILALAQGGGVGRAARSVGRSRQTAHVLRARPGSESFAAAWDAAIDLARAALELHRAGGPRDALTSFANGAETLLVPRFRRGQLIGFVQRRDDRPLMRTLRQLDRICDGIDARR